MPNVRRIVPFSLLLACSLLTGSYAPPELAPTAVTGTYATVSAATCGASQLGAMAIPTDSAYEILRCNGSTWDHYVSGIKVVPPVFGNFTWANQSSATTDTAHGGIIITAPANGGTNNVNMLVQSLPGSTYTLETAFRISAVGSNSVAGGLVQRDSVAGTLVLSGVTYTNGWGYLGFNYNSPTSASSGIYADIQYRRDVYWAKTVVDGTNRTQWYSNDGVNYIAGSVVSKTSFVTPNQNGFAINVSNASYGGSVWLLHWTTY